MYNYNLPFTAGDTNTLQFVFLETKTPRVTLDLTGSEFQFVVADEIVRTTEDGGITVVGGPEDGKISMFFTVEETDEILNKAEYRIQRLIDEDVKTLVRGRIRKM